MKKALLAVTIICLLALSVSAQAMMGSGGTTSMVTGSGTGTTSVNSISTGINGMMGTTYMQMPTGQQMFEYGPTTVPVAGPDVSTTMPLGVGAVAMGGDTITVQAAVNQFSSPMDLYLTIYMPAIDPFNVWLMLPDGSIHPVTDGFEPWMTGVTAFNETPVSNMSTSTLPKGTYTLGLMATPSGGDLSTYYLWTTHFTIQ